MVGSLLFLGVSPVVALVTSRFVRMSIGTPLRMGCREKKGWVLRATGVPKHCKYYKCKEFMEPISSNASQPEMVRKFASGLAPAGIRAMVKKQKRKLWRLIYFSNNICMYFGLCLCALWGFLFNTIVFYATPNRSGKTTRILWSSSGGSQPSPINPGRFAEGWGSSHWRWSQIVDQVAGGFRANWT